MNLCELSAISPIDGRYRGKTVDCSPYFSEYALIRYRVIVEVEYFIALCNEGLPQLPELSGEQKSALRKIYSGFDLDDAQWIKDTEKVINHDVKSVEYFVKEQLKSIGLSDYIEFVHFGLTSQDINNTAVPLTIKDAMNKIYFPFLDKVVNEMNDLAKSWEGIPMLAHTHGQPASPTSVGKEMAVFVERLVGQIELLKLVPHTCKFGGATGNYNAHKAAYPSIDWRKFGNKFCSDHLGLDRQQLTTQIEHYDHMSALFDGLKRINTILVDFCRDFWTYISMEYFTQKVNKNEVGSSAMPHKVNPIDFENAEGNLGIANALFEFLGSKLPVSRLQRDLTDSTVLRNVGVPFSHTLIALTSIKKGLSKVQLNESVLAADLEKNVMVLAEAIQTVLRREGYDQPYEKLKSLTRGNERVTMSTITEFIGTLEVSDSVKAELNAFTPHNYIGYTSI